MVATTISQEKILSRLQKLASKGKYETGLRILEDFLKQNLPNDEIQLKHAFFLYHYGANLKYSSNAQNNSRQKQKIAGYFNGAIRICRELIKKRKKLPERIHLNARIYLAQIYAMLGKKTKAKELAKETYEYFPSSLSAERAADVNFRLNDFKRALYWYRLAVKNAEKTDEKATAHTGLAILYKNTNNIKKSCYEAQIALRLIKGVDCLKLLKEILYAHIPELETLNKKLCQT